MNTKQRKNVKVADMDILKQRKKLVYFVVLKNMVVQLVMNVDMKKMKMEMKPIILFVKIVILMSDILIIIIIILTLINCTLYLLQMENAIIAWIIYQNHA